MPPIFFEPDPPAFLEGVVVVLRKPQEPFTTRDEFTVEWHREGSVHCSRWVNAEKLEYNFNACDLKEKT